MNEWLEQRFATDRSHLRAVAYRMLGSLPEADDAVQEAWLRVSRADASAVDNLGGWLTTIVARVCLDMLRSRSARREEPMESAPAERGVDPEADLAIAQSLGPALLLVLETLAPAERVAFVLHDMFDLPFEEIAPIVGRSVEAARQLASRARRRVQGGEPSEKSDLARRREVVSAFLAASREGDFGALLAVLDPDARLTADAVAVHTATANGWPLDREVRGARAVAEVFKGRARGATTALLDGLPGAVWAPGGKVRSAFVFDVEGEKIVRVSLVMEPARLASLHVELGGFE